MFHKSKSGFNEYWSYNDGLFTLLYTLVAVDFYHVEALPGSFIWSEVTILWFIYLYSVVSPLFGYWRPGTADYSQPEGSNSQRNVFHGICLFINFKNMNFWSWTTFHRRSYMLENLTLLLWELWRDLKNLTLYIEKLCVWELVILEAVRDVCCNLALCGMVWLGKILCSQNRLESGYRRTPENGCVD